MLERRDYAKGEMVDKLLQKGITPSDAQAVADRFEELGLINDERFAGIVARHYAAKRFGPGKIKSEFVKRRVPKEYWESALEEIAENNEDGAYAALCIKLRGKEPNRDAVRKASNSLCRRGFSWDDINSAVNRFLSEGEF